MAGPTPAFLAALNAGLAPGPEPTLDLPVDTITPQGAKFAAPPAVYNAPQSSAWVPPSDPFGTAKAPPMNASGVPNPQLDANAVPLPPTGTYGVDNPRQPTSFTRSDPTQDPGAAPADGTAAPPPMNPDVQFAPVVTGGSPAREVNTRGPQQEALLQEQYMPPLMATENVRERSVQQAAAEQAMHEEHAKQALDRQAAFERQAARRAQEMQILQADYQNTITELSRFKIDNNRVWNNTSTLDKIGALALVLLGGVGAGPSGNIVLQSIMGNIQEDVDKQKDAYQKGLDLAKGQQSAFGMAMQKYNSEDAAYNAALAAGQEAVAAKIAGMSAQWKGTDAQNHADALVGQLASSAIHTRAEGLKYLQPTGGSTKYKMFVRGQERPGLATEAGAQAVFDKYQADPAVKGDEQLLGGAIQANLQDRKAMADAAKTAKQFTVVMPNGEEVNAPDEPTAKQLRKVTAAVNNANSLVNEAREIRKGSAWRIKGSTDRARLETIESELTLAFKERGELGALSGPDMDLARGGTGEITSQFDTANAKLESFSKHTNNALRNYVKTIPGAPPKTSGVMPGSFTAHGKK